MGSRGSASGGAKAIAGATRAADRAVTAFIDRENGMASDGEINGVYEQAFIKEATRLGASNLQINNALNNALRTNDVDYMGARGGSRVIQVLDGNRKPVFEGVFNDYQDFVRSGKFKDNYSTRVIKK